MQGKLSLIVQPGDSFFPIVRAIDKAERTVNLTIFRLDDPIVSKALREARERGVRVRLLISSSARGWEEKNRKLLKEAKKGGIATKEPAGDSKRSRFHYKILTVDGLTSLVFTFNPTRENLHYTRDFGLEIVDKKVATELDRLFEADWEDMEFKPDAKSPLLISPYNSRAKMERLFEGATRSIDIFDAKVEDRAILELLRKKAADGVEVRILGDAKHGGSFPKGITFRAVPRFKLHAKCSIVDGERAVLGSMNLRSESFDRRREVCVYVEEPDVLKRLTAVFESDWEQKARPSSSAATIISRAPGAGTASLDEGLFLVSRTDALRRHALRDGELAIGRSEENDVVVSDALASRFHARVILDGERCAISDLGSHNGTFVNGQRIERKTKLSEGDIVSIAGVEEFRLVRL
jgi:phosphatidylserine/phosphatidylglycerophosphate/cardiolipin synthase-like enzyme